MSLKKILLVLALIFVIVGFVNFFVLIISSSKLGGDALNGYVKNGRFYVSEHGVSTEVDKKSWEISRLQAMSVNITHPLLMLGMFYLLIETVFPKLLYKKSKESIKNKVIKLNLKVPLVEFKSSGKIGSIIFRGNLLKIKIYKEGVVIKPIFMQEFIILKAEIKDISEQNKLFFDKEVKIMHSSDDVESPVILFVNSKFSTKLISYLG